jgi:prepilin-type N-terminal cleavage/methylation domain-containing protein
MRLHHRNKNAFTLVEIMIVVAIIGDRPTTAAYPA